MSHLEARKRYRSKGLTYAMLGNWRKTVPLEGILLSGEGPTFRARLAYSEPKISTQKPGAGHGANQSEASEMTVACLKKYPR